MPESLEISLRYSGPSVDDGTMPLNDVVDALQGFSGAYTKVANFMNPEVSPQLRVAAIKKGSFQLEILGLIVSTVAAHEPQLKAVELMWHYAKYAFKVVTELIRVKKHTQGKPYTLAVKGDGNNVNVINAENVTLNVTIDTANIMKAKLVDGDLNKIATPLRKDAVQKAELVAREGQKQLEEASITSEERDFFRPEPISETAAETEMEGRLVSLNKETNRGTFKLNKTDSVPYHYIGKDKESFHADFSYKGPVRATCVAHYDENNELISIDIKSVERLQGSFQFPEVTVARTIEPPSASAKKAPALPAPKNKKRKK